MTTKRFAILGPELDAGAVALAQATALLDRYGVVTRQVIALEESGWDWAPIEAALSHMELRGEARRGYFVRGLPGIQCATASAVEQLRTAADPQATTLIPARDPALVLERDLLLREEAGDPMFAHFSRSASTLAGFAGQELVLLLEEQGRKVVTAASPTPQALETLLRLFRNFRAAAGKRSVIATWNGTPGTQSTGRDVLAALGFREDFRTMVFDAVQARAAGLS